MILLAEWDDVLVDIGEASFGKSLHFLDFFWELGAEVVEFGGVFGEFKECCAGLGGTGDFGIGSIEEEFPVAHTDGVEAFFAVPDEQVLAWVVEVFGSGDRVKDVEAVDDWAVLGDGWKVDVTGVAEAGEQVDGSGECVVFLSSRDGAGPADDAGHSVTTFQSRPFGTAVGSRLSFLTPLWTVVRKEDDEGILVDFLFF